jgi:hypothetical protein
MRVVNQSRPVPRGDHADRTYSAQDVRQGEIILKRPWQRAVFILGLAGAVALALFSAFAMYG